MLKAWRFLLWTIKGALLALAMAALVYWPVSRGQIMFVNVRKTIVRPTHALGYWNEVLCWDGRFCVSASKLYFAAGEIPQYIIDGGARQGDSLQWDHNAYRRVWEPNQWNSHWGPIQWSVYAPTEKGYYRQFAAPLWLVAFVTGAWPALSLALAVRRGVKRRRAAREGLCRTCGYDIRATPNPSGELFPICPECGQPTHSSA
jgi:hypothetical protein